MEPTPTEPTAEPAAGPIAPSYDVVVVGARAAGASLAMLLARRGLHVLAIDRGTYGSDTLSTHSLSRSAVLLLSRWGVLDDIRAAGTPVTTSISFRYGQDPLEIAISADGDVDGLYSPRRTVLDAALVDEAVRSGATVRHRSALRTLTRDGDGRVTGVVVRHAGIDQTIRARWVVGADGTGSQVASQVRAETIHQEAHTAAVVYTFMTGLDRHRIENHFDVPGLAFGVVPTGDGAANVWAAMTPERFERDVRGDLAAGFERAIAASPQMAATIAGCRRVAGFRGFIGLPGYLRRPYGPGWALVGDAGYFKDPVSAHGITDAFVGAELLAAALDDAARGRASEEATLAQFQRQRDELAEPMREPVAALATLALDGDDAAAAFMRMNAALKREWHFLHSGAVADHRPLTGATVAS